MNVNRPKDHPAEAGTRRTQAERSESTRAALIEAARPLFAERGYADVGTEEIVRVAGVTRGALYHHFAGKQELFEAVYEKLEAELAERIEEGALKANAEAPMEALRAGVRMALEASTEPEMQRIALLDGPSVLGWDRWREIAAEYGLGMVEAVLGAAIEAGEIPAQPPRPLAHVLMGALDEAAMLIARAEDPEGMREDVGRTFEFLLDALSRGGEVGR
jgi:AcrR family transcriptional regulator